MERPRKAGRPQERGHKEDKGLRHRRDDVPHARRKKRHARRLQRALDACDRLKIMPHPMQVTPFPGTDLYEIYKPYLIPERGWEYYNGNRAVFTHDDPAMSVEKREQALFLAQG